MEATTNTRDQPLQVSDLPGQSRRLSPAPHKQFNIFNELS
jgi:hypothetical protein